MKQVKQGNNIYQDILTMLDIVNSAGSQFENSTMIWQGQLWKNQETYFCDSLLLAEDWLVAQSRQLVRQCIA